MDVHTNEHQLPHIVPMRRASSAPTGLPVSIMSMALERPMRAGNLTVPPSIRGTPRGDGERWPVGSGLNQVSLFAPTHFLTLGMIKTNTLVELERVG